jgi:hypothetical protein
MKLMPVLVVVAMCSACPPPASEGEGEGEGEGDGGGEGEGEGDADLPHLGACAVFTPDDAWNVDVSSAPVSDEWTAKFRARYGGTNLHPDFGNFGGEHFGIPINVVASGTAPVPITYDLYPEESDPGPVVLPSPDEIRIEGTDDPRACDGDCHILAVDQDRCELFEAWLCRYHDVDGYVCANGARFDMTRSSQGQRPEGFTSADAAGLSITAGLARFDEAAAGAIRHALRFTVECTQEHYVRPASHQAVAGGCDPGDVDAPPMGLRIRLRADFDTSSFSPIPRAFLSAMQTYGMILADNGSDLFFQSEDNAGWTDDLDELKSVPGEAFEVIEPGTFFGP